MAPKSAAELHALAHPRSKRNYKETNWAIKKLDAEPLLRHDIQWQVLEEIFADRTFRFTAPVDQNAPATDPIYLNFDQLYLEAILSSMKTTQNIRTKLISNPKFAMNYCKLCLLVNVGRVNTTLAFYANMKTALRTYHPVPSLQTEEVSQKEMSDAPRLKGMLKAAYLDWEANNQPTSLQAVAAKKASGEVLRGPPTTVIEAIFLVFNEAGWVSEKYFPEGFDLWDIFFPSNMPARPRAHAFLALMHHILESPTFLSDFTHPSPVALSPPIAIDRGPANPPENVDTPEELEFAREMQAVRAGVVKTVPAIQKKEEEAREKMAKTKEKEEAVQAGTPSAKRLKTEHGAPSVPLVKPKLSYVKSLHQQQTAGVTPEILPPGWLDEDWSSNVPSRSGLPVTWLNVKRDLLENRDPDYDSDEESAWPFDLLLRRQTLTMLNPSTGLHAPASSFAEYPELQRRKAAGEALTQVLIKEEGEEELHGAAGEGDNYLSPVPFHGVPNSLFHYLAPLRAPEPLLLPIPIPPPRSRDKHSSLVWNAAILLADRIACREEEVRGKRVLELGCGLGLPGIVAARMGAEKVVLSDYDNLAILADASRAANEALLPPFRERVEVVGHTWGESVAPLLRSSPTYDLILVADCVWERSLHAPLLSSLSALLAACPEATVLFAAGFHTGRATVSAFLSVAEEAGVVPLQRGEWREVSVEGEERRWDWEGEEMSRFAGGKVQEERQEERARWTLYGKLGKKR
ncbi:hypothetical protein JCM8097_004003 [Rhodosporidiobolus ruineniae]